MRSGEPAKISGYLGKSDKFDNAIADFAVAYADQSESDHEVLMKAVRAGKLEVLIEESAYTSRAVFSAGCKSSPDIANADGNRVAMRNARVVILPMAFAPSGTIQSTLEERPEMTSSLVSAVRQSPLPRSGEVAVSAAGGGNSSAKHDMLVGSQNTLPGLRGCDFL